MSSILSDDGGKKILLRLPKPMQDQLDRIAIANNFNRSEFIRAAIREKIATYENK